MTGQDGVDRRPKPHQAAAQVQRLDGERQHDVIDRGRLGRPDRDVCLGCIHRPYMDFGCILRPARRRHPLGPRGPPARRTDWAPARFRWRTRSCRRAPDEDKVRRIFPDCHVGSAAAPLNRPAVSSDKALMKIPALILCIVGGLFVCRANAAAAPSSLEDRYVAARDAAIKKLKPLYDAGTMDDDGTRVEDTARADLEAQLRAILGPVVYAGFGPGKLNLGSLFEVTRASARSTACASMPTSDHWACQPEARTMKAITSSPGPTSS